MPHKKKKIKKKKGASEKTRTWQEALLLSPEGEEKEGAPPRLSSLTPFFYPFLGQAVNSDESIRIIINWITLLLFGFFSPFC